MANIKQMEPTTHLTAKEIKVKGIKDELLDIIRLDHVLKKIPSSNLREGVSCRNTGQVNFKTTKFQEKSLPCSSTQNEPIQGASTVKWTTPCLMFSTSDSKLYTKFEFCEETNHKHFKNVLVYKAKQTMMTKKFQEKSMYFENMVQVVCKQVILNK